MATGRTNDQLRAISFSGLCVAEEREQVKAANLGDGTIGISFGAAATTERDGNALLDAADQELLAAKDRLYERGDR